MTEQHQLAAPDDASAIILNGIPKFIALQQVTRWAWRRGHLDLVLKFWLAALRHGSDIYAQLRQAAVTLHFNLDWRENMVEFDVQYVKIFGQPQIVWWDIYKDVEQTRLADPGDLPPEFLAAIYNSVAAHAYGAAIL